MRKSITGFKASVFVIITLAIPLVVRADADRTWVSGPGDDANNCSRAAPCKTFVGAMVRTNVGGEINCVTSGGFGAIIINKSITIDGTGCFAGILPGNTNGINIFITAQADAAKTVRLRGLSINGIGSSLNGIKVTAARRVFIENVVIDGFGNNGIQVDTPDANVYVKDTTIRNIAKSGINVQPTANSPLTALWIDRVSLLNNFTGIFVGKGARATIRDSDIIHHKSGAVAEKGELNIVDCLLTENSSAIDARTDSTIRISLITVTNNESGLLASDNGKIISFKNNVVNGNAHDGVPTETISPP